MHDMRHATWAALLALSLALSLAACSKDKSTDPGGNPSGTAFDIALPPGRSTEFTFDHAATHPYHCGVHPSMTGTVTIGATGGDSAHVTVSSVAGGFNPPAVTIKVGGKVRWENTSGSIPHSAVSD